MVFLRLSGTTTYVAFLQSCSVYEHIDQMMLGVNSEGALCAQSQVEDYICRGDALEQYNLLDYFVDTYEDDLKKRDPKQTDSTDDSWDLRGRPTWPRVPYQTSHPRHKRKVHVLRSVNRRTLPMSSAVGFPDAIPSCFNMNTTAPQC